MTISPKLPFLKTHQLMAIALGLVYIWFGVLKFFPFLSPADTIAKATITELSFGLIPEDISILLLAILETCIGIVLLSGIWRKTIIIITFCHMLCTFTPLFLFPDMAFSAPMVPKLLGQYIGKNIIILSVLVALYTDKKQPQLPSSSLV